MKGVVERIGIPGSFIRFDIYGKGDKKIEEECVDVKTALKLIINTLTQGENAVIADLSEISAVGQRVVHGGERFKSSVLINDEVLEAIKNVKDLAPLHNPSNIAGIEAAQELLPEVPQVAVFDTAFHQTMPAHAFHYGLPYEFYERYGVRRYGFHGTSHVYVARAAARRLGREFGEFSCITCHLGNGCSMAAVKRGESVDTSMGLTPLEGLLMGTRSGDMDPAIVFFLAREAGVAFAEFESLLNTRSGLLGVSGVSNDVRTLWEAAANGNERAALALEMFAYRVKKYVGAYLAVLNGCEAVIFTGGIGENDARTRERICGGMETLGMELDAAANRAAAGGEAVISAPGSRVKLLVVPTNEELEIAGETAPFARGKGKDDC